MRIHSLALSVSLVVAGAGCASPPISADEHRQLAAKEEMAAAEHAARYDEGASKLRVSTPPGENAPLVEEYNPTHVELVAAEDHSASAERHRKAAQALEASEDAACTSITPAARSACPLLSPVLVEDTAHGVRVIFADAAHATKAAELIRCQQAFARTRAFNDLPSCALYAPGLKLEQRGAVLELSAKDTYDVERLRGNIRGHHR